MACDQCPNGMIVLYEHMQTSTAFTMHPCRFRPSNHALARAYERGITTDMIRDTLVWGRKLHRQGLRFHVMLRRCVPHGMDERYSRRLVNVTVVVGVDDTIVTVYRNPKALYRIKRKSKRLL